MPAVVAAPTGTWTTLSFDTVDAGPTKENVPTLQTFDGSSLANVDFDELRQFVQHIAAAYGIKYQPALVLTQILLRGLISRSFPTLTDSSVYSG